MSPLAAKCQGYDHVQIAYSVQRARNNKKITNDNIISVLSHHSNLEYTFSKKKNKLFKAYILKLYPYYSFSVI